MVSLAWERLKGGDTGGPRRTLDHLSGTQCCWEAAVARATRRAMGALRPKSSLVDPVPPARLPRHPCKAVDPLSRSPCWCLLANITCLQITKVSPLRHRWQTQGPQAESSPPPCFIWPSTLFLSGGSAELLAPS